VKDNGGLRLSRVQRCLRRGTRRSRAAARTAVSSGAGFDPVFLDGGDGSACTGRRQERLRRSRGRGTLRSRVFDSVSTQREGGPRPGQAWRADHGGAGRGASAAPGVNDLRIERELLRKRRPSSRRRASAVCFHPRGEGRAACLASLCSLRCLSTTVGRAFAVGSGRRRWRARSGDSGPATRRAAPPTGHRGFFVTCVRARAPSGRSFVSAETCLK
jgi:hypothetical protein